MNTCSIDGCDKKMIARGMCNRHYLAFITERKQVGKWNGIHVRQNMNYGNEIKEIGQLILSATLIQEIRKQVACVMRDGFMVTDGIHHPLGSEYDVVVKCGSEDRPDVFRRIRGSIPNVHIEKIADGVLGIRQSRRMRGKRM